MADQIDTRHSANFRKLRFNSIEDCIAEINRILTAHQAGKLRYSGNWTPGQIMTHLSAWIEYGYDGYPVKPPPFFVRWILRWQLPKMLRNGMPRGIRIPGVKGGTTGMDELATEEAGQRLLNAWARLQRREEASYDSPAFGPMSHDDRILLNLRHAELHLGYLSY